MRTSYGVAWREDSGPLASGKANFLPDALQLDGLCRRMPTVRTIAYTDIAVLRRLPHGGVTVDGQPTVLLELRSGERLEIASGATGMLVGELTTRLNGCLACAAPA